MDSGLHFLFSRWRHTLAHTKSFHFSPLADFFTLRAPAFLVPLRAALRSAPPNALLITSAANESLVCRIFGRSVYKVFNRVSAGFAFQGCFINTTKNSLKACLCLLQSSRGCKCKTILFTDATNLQAPTNDQTNERCAARYTDATCSSIETTFVRFHRSAL
jgi:hypothetical protein